MDDDVQPAPPLPGPAHAEPGVALPALRQDVPQPVEHAEPQVQVPPWQRRRGIVPRAAGASPGASPSAGLPRVRVTAPFPPRTGGVVVVGQLGGQDGVRAEQPRLHPRSHGPPGGVDAPASPASPAQPAARASPRAAGEPRLPRDADARRRARH